MLVGNGKVLSDCQSQPFSRAKRTYFFPKRMTSTC
jgi:hypothetical protein